MTFEDTSSVENKHLRSEEDVDLRELFAALWAAKYSILSIVFISGVISALVALSIPNKYTSEALLAPRASGGPGGALGQMASQFGGLASLAGVSIGGLSDQGSTVVAVEMLKSRAFFRTYLYEAVLVDLMAGEGWDPATGEVLVDASRYDVKKASWIGDFGRGQNQPSVQEAHRVFTQGLSVIEDSKTGFVKVAVTHYSPTVAQAWVSLIVKGVNEAVRARDVEEAKKSINFLNQQRLKTNLVSLTEVFADLIEQQTKTVMLAAASDEYVFQVIEPPVAPDLKSEPRRALMCVVGTLFGGLLSVLLVLVRHFSRKEIFTT